MTEELNQSPSEENTLAGRGYKLVRQLGEGSYAKVFLAEYTPQANAPDEKKNQLACKIIDTVKAPKDFVRKFLPRELDILVKLNHPHIIHVHSIFQRRTKYFIFMRFAENGDLLDFVLKNGAVAESQSRVWFRQLCLAVQYLHEMEIAHRDLKCENILITANFNIKLADFGFARLVVDAHGRHVLSDTYCGSLSYAAPEVLRGSPYNPKISDIWSIGVILYIMLNKAMPFDDTHIKRLYEQQTNRRWKFRAKVADLLSDEVKKLISNLIEPDVAKRWHLEQILSSEWISMDSRLLQLTAAEQQALFAAAEERRNAISKFEDRRRDMRGRGPPPRSGERRIDDRRKSTAVEAAEVAASSGKPNVTVIKDSARNMVPQPSDSKYRS